MNATLLGALLALVTAAALAVGEARPGEHAADEVQETATERRDPHLHFFQAGFGDLPEEMQLARDAGKLGLFVMFGAEDCPPCMRMKETVLNRPAVQDYYRTHFRVLYIDFNGDVEMTDLAGRALREKDYAREVARVIGTPTFVFLLADGHEPARYAGATRDAEEFLWLAEYVVDGAWREQDFTAYRSERAQAR